MPINLLADSQAKPINLLAQQQSAPSEQSQGSFYDLSPEDQDQTLELAKQKISKEHPNLPDWMRDLLLQITPKDESPTLDAAARGVSKVTNYIPAAAGGLLQGASIPIRGVAGLIPTDFTQKLANSPDLRDLFPKAEGTGQKSVQTAAELIGGGGLFGKLMQGLKGAAVLGRVPQALQNPLALAGAGAIATPGDATNRALGAGGALALGGAAKVGSKIIDKASDKLPAFFRGLTTKSTPEELVKAAQMPHDKLQSTADELYGQVRSAINKREIKIPMNQDFLKQARSYYPQNKPSTDALFERAAKGDYKAIHEIQSGLYKKGTKQLAGDDLAKENEGEEIIELRDRMNDFLDNHLIKEGHLDIAHVLRQGKKTYAELMNTYYPKLLRKGVGKMVHSDLRLVPKNPENLFDENSVPMKAFLDKHPEVAKHLQGVKEKKEAGDILKKLLIGVGAGGATVTGGKVIHDVLR